MRVGSIGYCTDQGLGHLLRSFHDAGVVTDVTLVSHGRREEHPEWFPGARRITSLKDGEQLRLLGRWVEDLDVLLAFETPFVWDLLNVCRSFGVKSILCPMYECCPRVLPAEPDAYFCSSKLDFQYYVDGECPPAPEIEPFRKYPGGCYFTPVPVDTVPWKLRTEARVFVHNAGHGGLKGRNGTAEVVEAIKHLKTPAKILIRSQDPLPVTPEMTGFCSTNRLEIRTGTFPRGTLYDEGDVFLFPEKFNGLSLPIQEARASGMLVMGTNRFPMNDWLPPEPLIPVNGIRTNRVSPMCNDFVESIVEPRDIAKTIDAWYGADLTAYSESGKVWAERNSWAALGPMYQRVLEEVVGR